MKAFSGCSCHSVVVREKNGLDQIGKARLQSCHEAQKRCGLQPLRHWTDASMWHILLYMPRKAKIFMNNRSQAVRLPKDFQFNVEEVFIRKEGSDVVLSPRPTDWSSYLSEAPIASPSFMENVEDLPVQERKR